MILHDSRKKYFRILVTSALLHIQHLVHGKNGLVKTTLHHEFGTFCINVKVFYDKISPLAVNCHISGYFLPNLFFRVPLNNLQKSQYAQLNAINWESHRNKNWPTWCVAHLFQKLTLRYLSNKVYWRKILLKVDLKIKECFSIRL